MTSASSWSWQYLHDNALFDLYAGAVNPLDREILAASPLPSDVIDPYASRDMDPVSTMNMAYSAMTVWIDEAKKANYFSGHFITLSRMIMNGTVTMARGLVTLHARGESPDQAPMSICDLISLGSYHYRKSYLGMMQTIRSHPEISERLLINQLSWCNLLLRLHKTKERLAKPVLPGSVRGLEAALEPGTPPEGDIRLLNAEAPDAVSTEETAGEIKSLPASDAPAFEDPAAFRAPGVFAPQRSFSSFDRTLGSGSRIPKQTDSGNNAGSGEILPEAAAIVTDTAGSQPDGNNTLLDPAPLMPEAVSADPEPEAAVTEEETRGSDAPGKAEPAEVRAPEAEKLPPETKPDSPGPAPGGNADPPDPLHPPYIQILAKALARSGPSQKDPLIFTLDELRVLASDPAFRSFDPESARNAREFLEEYEGSG